MAHVGEFWDSLWDYFDLKGSRGYAPPLADKRMPGAVWFPGARLNYAENIFAKMKPAGSAEPEGPVIIYKGESGPVVTLSRQEILEKTTAVAARRSLDTRKGRPRVV